MKRKYKAEDKTYQAKQASYISRDRILERKSMLEDICNNISSKKNINFKDVFDAVDSVFLCIRNDINNSTPSEYRLPFLGSIQFDFHKYTIDVNKSLFNKLHALDISVKDYFENIKAREEIDKFVDKQKNK